MHSAIQKLIEFCEKSIELYNLNEEFNLKLSLLENVESNKDENALKKSVIERDFTKPIEIELDTFVEILDDRIFKFDSILQSQVDRAFGEDLSDATIHTGPYADAVAKSLDAEAVTIGPDIFFRAEKYAPETEEGKKLLTHELQHVIQYLKDDRMVYLEDIQSMEMEAESKEKIIEDISLYDMNAPYLKNEALQSIADGEIRDKVSNKLDEQNKNLDNISADDFITRSDKPLYKYNFSRTGKSYKVTKEEKEEIINTTLNKFKREIQEETFGMTEDVKEKYLLKLIKYFS